MVKLIIRLNIIVRSKSECAHIINEAHPLVNNAITRHIDLHPAHQLLRGKFSRDKSSQNSLKTNMLSKLPCH